MAHLGYRSCDKCVRIIKHVHTERDHDKELAYLRGRIDVHTENLKVVQKHLEQSLKAVNLTSKGKYVTLKLNKESDKCE